MKYFFLMMCVLCVACGAENQSEPFLSLSNLQPEVKNIVPENAGELKEQQSIIVILTQEVDLKSVDTQSFAVERLVGENRLPIAGSYSVQAKELTFTPEQTWTVGEYEITLTHEIITKDYIPLKGTAEENYLRYVSHFSVLAGESSVNSMPANTDEISERDPPALPPLARPEKLVINELLYDVPGDDRDGKVFVELFGTPHTFIDDYEIRFINGDGGEEYGKLTMPSPTELPEDGVLVLADQTIANQLVSNVANADLLFDFDPQNGPDCVQLADENGELVDALGYGSLSSSCFEGAPAPDVASGISISRQSGVGSDNNADDFLPLEIPTPGEL